MLKKIIKKIIDPGHIIFTYTNRVLMHNFFRFDSFGEFRSWQSNLNMRRFLRQIDHRKIAPGSIPVILNNFNRLSSLETMIDWLKGLKDYVSILIIDNQSTYPPLMDYYRRIENDPRVQVIRLGFNSGRRGIFYIVKKLKRKFRYFVVSDTDLLPYITTPADILSKMRDLLDKYVEYNHVGASLEINDIPEHSPLKEAVLNWEKQYWPPYAQTLNDEVHVAAIDTTFAMYRNTSKVLEVSPALRMDRPYTLKHPDWYIDLRELSEEFCYYMESCKKGESSWIDYIRKQQLLNRYTLEEELLVQ